MPGVLVPELAAKMELMLIAGVVGVVDDKSELTPETELIASLLCRRRHKMRASFQIRSFTWNPKTWRQMFKYHLIEREAEVEPCCGATSCITFHFACNYWTSFNTACWAWLDCCRAAMPVDCNTLYWVMLATVLPMSAF